MHVYQSAPIGTRSSSCAALQTASQGDASYFWYQLLLCFATIAKYHTKSLIPLLAKTQVPTYSATSDCRRCRHYSFSACCRRPAREWCFARVCSAYRLSDQLRTELSQEAQCAAHSAKSERDHARRCFKLVSCNPISQQCAT